MIESSCNAESGYRVQIEGQIEVEIEVKDRAEDKVEDRVEKWKSRSRSRFGGIKDGRVEVLKGKQY